MALSAILLERTDNSFIFSAFDIQGLTISALDDTWSPITWFPFGFNSNLNYIPYYSISSFDVLEVAQISCIDFPSGGHGVLTATPLFDFQIGPQYIRDYGPFSEVVVTSSCGFSSCTYAVSADGFGVSGNPLYSFDFPQLTAVADDSPRTMMFWVLIDTTGISSTPIISYGTSVGGVGSFAISYNSFSDAWEVNVDTGQGDLNGANNYNGQWRHIATTYNGTTGILYIDGVEADRNESWTLSTRMSGTTGIGDDELNIIGKGIINDLKIVDYFVPSGDVLSYYDQTKCLFQNIVYPKYNVLDTNVPYGSAIYAASGSCISGNTFDDGSLWAMFVSTVSTDGFGGAVPTLPQVTASVSYTPWSLQILTQYSDLTSASVCAVFTDLVSTYPLTTGIILDWNRSPTTNISAFSGTGTDDFPWVTAASYEVSGITIYSDATASLATFDISVSGVGSDSWRSVKIVGFGVNPRYEYSLSQTETSARAEAYLQRADQISITPSNQITWFITPTEGLSSTVITPGGPVSIDTQIGPDSAVNLESLVLRATSYTGIHTIGISGTNAISEIFFGVRFIPYLQWSWVDASTAFIDIDPLVENNQIRQYRVITRALSSNGIPYNLNPDYPIVWDDLGDSRTTGAINAVTGTTYTFLSDGGDFNLNRTVNPLFVGASTLEWNQVGVPGVDTFTITVTAASGYNNPTDTLTVLTTTISSINWVPDSYFKPRFALNYELTSTEELWREVANPYTLTVRDSSTLPGDPLTVNNFTVEFSTGDSILTASPYIIVSGLAINEPQTISINVTGEIALAGWPDTSIKTGIQKFVNFVGFFPQASAFIIYPERKWDGSSFVLVTSDPESLSPGVCAYGFCHTETFYFSAPSYPANALYYWSIEGITPFPISNLNAVASWPIPSTNLTETYSVSLLIATSALPATMPKFYNSDVDGSEQIYPNFSNTEEPSSRDTRLKDAINRPTVAASGTVQIDTPSNPFGVPAALLTLSGIIITPDYIPLQQGATNTLVWSISTRGWEYETTQNTETYTATFTIVDVPTANNQIAKFEPTIVNIDLSINTILQSKESTYTDWCVESVAFSGIDSIVSAYPLEPFIFRNNKFVLTGTNVTYQNLVPYFNLLSGFNWLDRGNRYFAATNSNYVTSYNTAGRYDLTLQTNYSGTDVESKTFSNIVTIINGFESFDTTVDRIIGITKVRFPNSQQICQVPPNEWCTAENLNRSFDKLNENLIYLQNQSKLYDSPPSEYFGWYGAKIDWDSDIVNRWRVNITGLDYGYLEPQTAIDGIISQGKDISVRKVANQGDNITLISDTTAVIMLSSDFFGTEINRVIQKGIGDEFVQIEAIDTDVNFETEHRVYTLDTVKNRVLVYQYNFNSNEFRFLYSWGGLGGPQARNKFNGPTGLLVDSENKLWITDSGNGVVKKFSRTGSWIKTYTSDFFDNNNKPRSTAIADDGSIHILSNNFIVKIDVNGVQTKYGQDYLSPIVPRSITVSRDGGYFYILATDRVLKITQTGVLAGSFGTEFGITNYRNLYHDENRNIYLISKNAIIKYIDKLDALNLTLDMTDLTWPMSAIYVNENEYVQDWIVNKSVARFYDNLEVFRRSIIGKFTTVERDGIQVPVVRTFTPQEYFDLPFKKTDIYVGMNEIVSHPVFNRVIDKLYACLETLRVMIEE